MWTMKARLSLLGIVGLPPIFFLSLTNPQQAIFLDNAIDFAGGLVIALLLGLVAGFIWWSSKVLKGVFTWVSVVYYSLCGLAWVTSAYPIEPFKHWGVSQWAWFLAFFGLWLVVIWCAWVLLRDVARPLLFASARELGIVTKTVHPSATHQQVSPAAISVEKRERVETQEEREAQQRALERWLEEQKRMQRRLGSLTGTRPN